MRGVDLVPIIGEVSELVDEHDLGSCAERRPGSSPGFPTTRPELAAADTMILSSCFSRNRMHEMASFITVSCAL